ncbi:uncharacterized protein LOC123321629 [Coccinella septempunctata]|uniref:uncharacterized protein LOC123321629 n=1 Tax=Coccinella septempunctata TaxID=41139 RepID=UPI001D08DC64|nr:uncharacterized protein LOC123321629 [Coccinella septempunctata]XP_044765278.1 uncharacterized protein LOC123321629 [Coccinella septempunctata]
MDRRQLAHCKRILRMIEVLVANKPNYHQRGRGGGGRRGRGSRGRSTDGGRGRGTYRRYKWWRGRRAAVRAPVVQEAGASTQGVPEAPPAEAVRPNEVVVEEETRMDVAGPSTLSTSEKKN